MGRLVLQELKPPLSGNGDLAGRALPRSYALFRFHQRSFTLDVMLFPHPSSDFHADFVSRNRGQECGELPRFLEAREPFAMTKHGSPGSLDEVLRVELTAEFRGELLAHNAQDEVTILFD